MKGKLRKHYGKLTDEERLVLLMEAAQGDDSGEIGAIFESAGSDTWRIHGFRLRQMVNGVQLAGMQMVCDVLAQGILIMAGMQSFQDGTLKPADADDDGDDNSAGNPSTWRLWNIAAKRALAYHDGYLAFTQSLGLSYDVATHHLIRWDETQSMVAFANVANSVQDSWIGYLETQCADWTGEHSAEQLEIRAEAHKEAAQSYKDRLTELYQRVRDA